MRKALEIVEKYHLDVTEETLFCLRQETPRHLNHVNSHVIGSVGQLCLAAAEKCRGLGYEVHILTDRLCCEAREAGSFLASLAGNNPTAGEKVSIAGSGLTTGERGTLSGSILTTGEKASPVESVPTSEEGFFSSPNPLPVRKTGLHRRR